MPPNEHGLNLTGLRDTLHRDEQALLVLRRHWIVYAYLGFYTMVFLVFLVISVAYRSVIFPLIP